MNKIVVLSVLLLTACSPAPDAAGTVHVAAASNLARLFPELARACQHATGLALVPSFGNTAQLAQQIANGGPFDLFLAADTKHVEDLARAGKIIPASVHNYAQGHLVLFAPRHPELQQLNQLAGSLFPKIGLAKPELSPYGAASLQALTRAGLWPKLESKAVYGQNISAVLQFVESSNVDAALTAMALVYDRPGTKLSIDPKLYDAIDQALGIITESSHQEQAQRVASWFVSAEAQALFAKAGYGIAAQDSGSRGAASPGTLKP